MPRPRRDTPRPRADYSSNLRLPPENPECVNHPPQRSRHAPRPRSSQLPNFFCHALILQTALLEFTRRLLRGKESGSLLFKSTNIIRVRHFPALELRRERVETSIHVNQTCDSIAILKKQLSRAILQPMDFKQAGHL